MAYPGLQWMKMEIPFASGLQQQTDDRARPQPFLDICKDVEHDVELGGLRTRLPYAAMSNSISGGGSLSNCRRLAVVSNELCVFTDTAIYSWNAQVSKWVNRGTHLAVAVNYEQRVATNGDQTICDRAELNGTVVYTWAEGTNLIWVAALSKTTGAMLMPPTSVAGLQARVLALSTKILFFLHESPTQNLTVRALDPADPATGFAAAATSIVATNMRITFDVVRVLGADQAVGACQMATNTTYTAFTVTAGLSVATSLKARTANGSRIAVASRPSAGAQTHIFRAVAGTTAVVGDVLTTSTLADVTVDQPIGTYTGAPLNFLTACYRSVQTAGHFVCVVFWTAQYSSTPATAFDSKTNTVDDAGTIGTQATFVPGVTIASRAFDYAGSVFINMLFAFFNVTSAGLGAQLNNQYLLYREDRTLHGKAVAPSAGTNDTVFGVRPGVASVDGLTFNWAATFRRSASQPPTPSKGISIAKRFGARSLVDVSVTFDSNAARRTAQCGRTMYIAGAEVLQYDGLRLTEVGFNAFQYAIDLADGGTATGSIAAGDYSYKSTFASTNAQGEAERSTTGAFETVTVAAGSSSVTSSGGVIGPLFTTRKTANPPAVEVWRTAVDPPDGAPYFLVTSLDPTALSNPNRYLPNSASGIATFVDALSDASLAGNLSSPENGAFLEALAPPGASIVVASDTRLFLGGVAGDPDRVWPSRQRGDAEVVSFHDGLPVDVPRVGGAITAIWFQDETLYISRQTALYVLPGDGLDNNGQGLGYGPARIVSLDVGAVSQESVALTPLGTIFLSRKGWQLLDRSGTLQYIGGPVRDYDSETVCSVDVVETQHQVRILTTARMIVWAYPRPDFPGGQWGEWTISDGVHSLMWNGTHVYLTSTGPKQQQSTYTSLTYGQDVEEAWIKPAGLVGSAKVRRIQPLGEYRSAFLLWMRIAYNYDPTYVDSVVWTPTPTTVGGPLQMMHAPSRPRCESIKVRLTAVTDAARATLLTAPLAIATDGVDWTATWQAASTKPGELGNAVTMAIAFVELAAYQGGDETTPIDVRENFRFELDAGWMPAVGNIGVCVLADDFTNPTNIPTVAELEAAIAAGTSLATLSSPDATPGKILDVASLVNSEVTGTFSGGAFGSPTGEALKLTGLGLEVGIEKATLYTGLSRAQKA